MSFAKRPRLGYLAALMFFLTPRHVKHGKQFAKDARKLLAYKRDVWNAATLNDVETHIKGLEDAVRTKEKAPIEEAAKKLDTLVSKLVPPSKDAWISENVEVFLVAIVVALGVRTYFLQPFTIPTGSMQPTLNGIVYHPIKDTPPNGLVRTVQGVIFGRQYIDFVAKEKEVFAGIRTVKSLLPFVNAVSGDRGVFTRTEFVMMTESGKEHSVIINQDVGTVDSQIIRNPNFDRQRVFSPGESILRGYFDAGDHVFVDKMSYHFRSPRRGDTFVFSTLGIPLIQTPTGTSTFYIKRLAGLPGDRLQIRAPELFINGQRAQEPEFARVMSGSATNPKDGYYGYANTFDLSRWDQLESDPRMRYLNVPDATFDVPQREYVALGDNSYNSSDSRVWGTVPEKNIMGRALVVYWPFWPHFGLTK